VKIDVFHKRLGGITERQTLDVNHDGFPQTSLG
jgi:hypothetical protein